LASDGEPISRFFELQKICTGKKFDFIIFLKFRKAIFLMPTISCWKFAMLGYPPAQGFLKSTPATSFFN